MMSPAMISRRWGVLATRGGLVLALMGAPTAAIAHPPSNPLMSTTAGRAHHHAWDMLASVMTEVPPAELGALLAAVAGLGLAWALRRHRRAWPIALAVIIASGAFEDGLHSVHHLADPEGAAKCAVAAASTHSEGVSAESRPIPAPEFALRGAMPARQDALLLLSLHALPDGRAPPLRSST
jgi:hypothetical protein